MSIGDVIVITVLTVLMAGVIYFQIKKRNYNKKNNITGCSSCGHKESCQSYKKKDAD